MSVVFHKMSGSGNDFVMVDGRVTTPAEWPAARIAAVCDRRNGIGGDGLVFVTPVGPEAVRMTYFNSDGSPAPMCGNAALCSTRLAARLEMVDPGITMTLETEAGVYQARCVGPSHMAELRLADIPLPEPAEIPREAGEESIHLATVGVPHLVALVESVDAVDVAARGRELRYHPGAGQGGANVNFVSRISTDGGSQSADQVIWALRTYERGIEAETLACGTGTVAAAAMLAAAKRAEFPLAVRTASGKTLTVSARLEGNMARDIWLCGEARVVGHGIWFG
jgi:diaminopimelate epimerase